MSSSAPPDGRLVVVKVGTSSLTQADPDSPALESAAIEKLCDEIATLRSEGHRVVLVSSAAIAAGMAKLGITDRPRDFDSLQALSAVGQIELMAAYDRTVQRLGFHCGQVLLAPPDFFDRARYLRARSCIERQLALDVLPIVNENDAVADDAIRFGDNDRIAALVAHLIHADLLVLLTDTPGLLTADPRLDVNASLIEEVQEVDAELEALAGGSASAMSQGGMASKLSAAKIAAWSGVDTVIAAADRPDVLRQSLAGQAGVGTLVRARSERLNARKLWIAFALGSSGKVIVDDGARAALQTRGGSLLAVGAAAIEGEFVSGDAVEIAGADGEVFAKGLVNASADDLRSMIGQRDVELVHRDDFVLLPGAHPG